MPLTEAKTALANVIMYGRVADCANAIGNVVSRVRHLLVETNCLTRESPLIRQYENPRRDRKILLSELSGLVNLAKREARNLEVVSHDLLVRSERVLNRACRFIHSIGTLTGIYAREIVKLHSIEITPTPPVSYDFSTPARRIHGEGESRDDLLTILPTSDLTQTRDDDQSAFTQLEYVHETLLSHLAAFIGRLRLQSQLQSASHVLLMTRQCVNAARALLASLESICTFHPDQTLTSTKDNLYTDITKLVTKARGTVDRTDGSVFETHRLVEAATGVVRGAGMCTLRAKHLLETLGDFACPRVDEHEEHTESATISRDDTSSSLASLVDRRQSRDVQSQVESLQVPYKRVAALTPNIPHEHDSVEKNSRDDDRVGTDDVMREIIPTVADTILSPSESTTREFEISRNQDGQITGGTLSSLVEQMSPADMMPDPTFFSSFFLTFRLFTSAVELSEELEARFLWSLTQEDTSWNLEFGTPIRLRIFNVFKAWLESYWRDEYDMPALPIIKTFADTTLKTLLPQAAKRLNILISGLTNAEDKHVISLLGKTTTAMAISSINDAVPPPSVISKAQIAMLRASTPIGYVDAANVSSCSIMDFDDLEIARQFTIIESKMFCAITPMELLDQEFSRKQGVSLAHNVKAMSAASTDLAGWVAESILWETEQKRRTSVLKHWIKIGERCAQLQNFNTLMAIMCALNSSTIARLKRTWDGLNKAQKVLLDYLRHITDHQRNYAVYRSNIRQASVPCLPFLGLYLTDLVFVDEGNPNCRPSKTSGRILINFDKHQKTTKVVSDLQRFQIPYKLQEVPELSAWITSSCLRMRKSAADLSGNLWRRSLIIEPKLPTTMRREPSVASAESDHSWSNKKLNFLMNW